jgi:hypothetical protein
MDATTDLLEDAITAACERIRAATDATRDRLRLDQIQTRKTAARNAATQVRPWFYENFVRRQGRGIELLMLALIENKQMSIVLETIAARQLIADMKWRLLHQPRTGFGYLTERSAENIRVAILAERLRIGARRAAETPIHTLTAAE